MTAGFSAPVRAHWRVRPVLYIDAQHGLCNRLRAMASAAAVADRTGRDLVVIWCPDHHCEAQIGDVLDYAGPVIHDRATADFLRSRAAHVYNYMEIEDGARFQEPILPERWPDQDIYVRSAYTLTSPHITLAAEQRFLRRLRPAGAVLDLMAGVPKPSAVAVHIRMSTGAEFDHLSYESPENWPAERHQELIEWRAKSHISRFVDRLRALDAEGRADTIFVAADLPGTYAQLAEHFGNRVRTLDRSCYDRSARQLTFAMADLLLLTAAPHFLASTWSSFSDLAQRLAGPGRTHEQSGLDF